MKTILELLRTHWKTALLIAWMIFVTSKLLNLESVIESIGLRVSGYKGKQTRQEQLENRAMDRSVSSIESRVSSIESDVSSIKRSLIYR